MATTAVSTKIQRIALLGNPNVGKSSLFNALTGLDQKVGNFPGVTVDKKTGFSTLANQQKVEIIDLPGLYSLFAKSPDERVVLEVLLNHQNELFPELIVFILDAANIERSLMLYSQVLDLGFEVLPILNLVDVAEQQGQKINVQCLEKHLKKQLLVINARTNAGLEAVKNAIANYSFLDETPIDTAFEQKLLQTQAASLQFLNSETQAQLLQTLAASGKDTTDVQLEDTMARMNRLHSLLDGVLDNSAQPKQTFTDKLDNLTTHPFWGYILYFGILFLIFQLLFSVAEYPMGWIEDSFNALNSWLETTLPESPVSDLFTKGIIAGIGGIVIFIPQIAFLFGLIAVLEETGYMSRVVFLMDKPMRVFGLSGKSIVPLISGAACAVPAIMSARNIDNWTERLTTIFVTPFISCAARLPVYIILIGLVIPDQTFLGFNLQGLTLLVLYLLGIAMALLTAMVMSFFWRKQERPLFVIDLPSYKMPRWKNVLTTIYQKTKTFVVEAGKIILAISILLWAAASYGPPQAMQEATEKATIIAAQQPNSNYEEILASQKLEASYIGHLGHFIEPAIRPLGYDWKIGIALITSFAAREVFIGTLGTIYSVGEENMEERLSEKMKKETFADNGKPVYTLASGLSLLIFYVFAMQCMSTLAIVYRETGGWKWALIQLFYMSGLAYIFAFATFYLFS